MVFVSCVSRRPRGAAALLAALPGQGAHAGVRGGRVQPAALPSGQEAPPRAAGVQPPAAPDGSGQQAGERDRKTLDCTLNKRSPALFIWLAQLVSAAEE